MSHFAASFEAPDCMQVAKSVRRRSSTNRQRQKPTAWMDAGRGPQRCARLPPTPSKQRAPHPQARSRTRARFQSRRGVQVDHVNEASCCPPLPRRPAAQATVARGATQAEPIDQCLQYVMQLADGWSRRIAKPKVCWDATLRFYCKNIIECAYLV